MRAVALDDKGIKVNGQWCRVGYAEDEDCVTWALHGHDFYVHFTAYKKTGDNWDRELNWGDSKSSLIFGDSIEDTTVIIFFGMDEDDRSMVQDGIFRAPNWVFV